MNRANFIDRISQPTELWDFIVIGGGATGLGVAVDAASRGYRTLLLEQGDFAQGTSSRSTKLVHGGVRYLKQGNISLVLEALRERGLLIRNAPHLVHNLSFIVPNYDWWEGPFYGIGLKLYDMLAGELGIGPSSVLTLEETLQHIPTLEPQGLRGGVIYYDGQFDDARLAITLAQTLDSLNGVPLNYMQVNSLLKSSDIVRGVVATDIESGKEYTIQSRVVINATGVFSDELRRMDEPDSTNIIAPSQGVHLVLDQSFLPGDSAIMVPQTDDGRVLFAVPWHDRVIVGTTDTPVTKVNIEPRPMEEEIEFLLTHAARYLTKDPKRSDILSCFAGLRPLIKAGNGQNTASLSRDHSLTISKSGLVTITGGKWTTYRKMAEDTVNEAAAIGGLPTRECLTSTLRLYGWQDGFDKVTTRSAYGSELQKIQALEKSTERFAEPIAPGLPYTFAEVQWAIENEMARTVADVLARRTRALLLDARASIAAAPQIAKMMRKILGHKRSWEKQQVEDYKQLARGYLGK